MTKKQRGFSLIELIVVITIMAVVTVIAVVNFGGTNRKARDGRRMADLEKIRVALEMIKQVGSTYPASLNTLQTAGYLQQSPQTDPKGFTYYYVPASYSYTLDAQMEDAGSTTAGAPFSNNCGGECNYRVRNP